MFRQAKPLNFTPAQVERPEDRRGSRFKLAGSIFRERACFKIVCGAGNESPEDVRRLAKVYALAGSAIIDVSANEVVVRSALAGIEEAWACASDLGIELTIRPFVTVSIGLKGDPHVRKARIRMEVCTGCGACLAFCHEEGALDIEARMVVESRCNGCGHCEEACPEQAIYFEHTRIPFQTVLPQCLAQGAEMLELHAAVADDTAFESDWRMVDTLVPDNYVSVCIDRSHLSDQQIVERINWAKSVSGERLIVQADGVPMSGGRDDFGTTLQAIAISDMIAKRVHHVVLLASGGTNSKTGELARLAGVPINGVSVGTYARDLVKDVVHAADFDQDLALLRVAVLRARALVRANLEAIHA